MLKLASEELSKETKDKSPERVLLPKNTPNKKAQRKLTPMKEVSVTSPVIPAVILQRISNLTHESMPKKKADVIVAVAKYWALKKESIRGAALLKRLHLEVIFDS